MARHVPRSAEVSDAVGLVAQGTTSVSESGS